MTFSRYIEAARGIRSRRGLAVAATIFMLPLAACDLEETLEVVDPDIATPESLADSTALPVLHAGAVRDFALAYGSSGETGGGSDAEGEILISGLLSDEFTGTDSFDTRIRIDQRDVILEPNGTSSNGQLQDPYRNLHRARRSAETAADRFEEFGRGSSTERAELQALAGFTYIFFGENWCSGVPFSEFPAGAPAVFGESTPTADIFARGIQRFDAAIATAQAAGDDEMLNLARVGKGRALLNRGEFAAAAAAVAGVPTDFEYTVFYSLASTPQYNGVYEYTLDSRRYGVSDREGGNGLPYRSDNDPRVPWVVNDAPNFDTTLPFPHFAQQLYTTRESDIPLATGVEARLIEAEAALQAGGAGYLTILNDLRATVPGLAPLTDPGTEDGRVDQLFKERAYWMWLTSHRLGDLRRLIRQYGRTADETFPSGEFTRPGDTFGSDVSLPLFVDEGNNPNFTSCPNDVA